MSPSVQASLLFASPDIPVVSGAPDVVSIPSDSDVSTGPDTSEVVGVPAVPAVSCAAVGPTVDVFLSQFVLPWISC